MIGDHSLVESLVDLVKTLPSARCWQHKHNGWMVVLELLVPHVPPRTRRHGTSGHLVPHHSGRRGDRGRAWARGQGPVRARRDACAWPPRSTPSPAAAPLAARALPRRPHLQSRSSRRSLLPLVVLRSLRPRAALTPSHVRTVSWSAGQSRRVACSLHGAASRRGPDRTGRQRHAAVKRGVTVHNAEAQKRIGKTGDGRVPSSVPRELRAIPLSECATPTPHHLFTLYGNKTLYFFGKAHQYFLAERRMPGEKLALLAARLSSPWPTSDSGACPRLSGCGRNCRERESKLAGDDAPHGYGLFRRAEKRRTGS